MLNAQVNTDVIVEVMSGLTIIQEKYPGSSVHLVLYTSGDGALVFERSLLGMADPDKNRVAVDFDAGDELAALENFRQKLATRFGE